MKFVPTTRWGKFFAILGGVILLLIIISVAQGASNTNLSSSSANTSSDPVSSTTPAATVKKAPEHTVKFVVTGSPAYVTYGHGGSATHGSVPMHLTVPLNKSATDYTLTAVLGESGHVTAKILVDGKVIAKATADGQYQSATVVITKDPFTDQWENSLGA